MKRTYLLFLIFLVLLISCHETENESLEMRVSHYQDIEQRFPGPYLSYVVQVDEEIGTLKWSSISGIEDFEYEWGYNYKILVERKPIHYDGVVADAFQNYRYIFLEELSKEKVPEGTLFNIILQRFYEEGSVQKFFEVDNESGFTILGTKSFDCTDLCDELTKEREDRTVLTGTFEFLEDGEIKLVDLKSHFFR